MRFGVFQGLTATTWEGVRELWRHVEDTGWDAACVTDHFMPNTPDRVGDAMECWTTLAALAAVTPRMRVGTIVAGNTYRHPAVLAKMAAQVDIISGGRLICGLGAAWQQNEHEAYGIPFYTVGERLGRLDEACQVLKALWTGPKTTFEGRYYRLADAPLSPKPVQQPHPELMIGGGGEKVTLRIVARHADHWNVWGGPETLARKGRILDGYCAAIGRDPKAITRSANMPLAITEDPVEIERLKTVFMRRMDRTAEAAADTLLAGPPSALREKLARMREAGVDLVWVPTMFLPKDARPLLDRFMR
ncbi:MAG: LLM class F420-dependent oxidoreductase, partial [candidate division NC10 bacterium]